MDRPKDFTCGRISISTNYNICYNKSVVRVNAMEIILC